MSYKVQVRRGPDGAHVDHYKVARLAGAQALAESVPPEGCAGIWRADRMVRAWYWRDADGTLHVSDGVHPNIRNYVK